MLLDVSSLLYNISPRQSMVVQFAALIPRLPIKSQFTWASIGRRANYDVKRSRFCKLPNVRIFRPAFLDSLGAFHFFHESAKRRQFRSPTCHLVTCHVRTRRNLNQRLNLQSIIVEFFGKIGRGYSGDAIINFLTFSLSKLVVVFIVIFTPRFTPGLSTLA